MYKDIENTVIYYENMIINEFVKTGIYPNNNLIKSRLNDIDTRLSIFRHTIVKEGSSFDTKQFNKNIDYIYNDLKILYKILYEITVEEYNNLRQYIQTHLVEMQEYANTYLEKANLEAYSTSLGKTILFKDRNFSLDYNDTDQIISLGQIELEDACKILCIINISNIDYGNVILNLYDGANTYKCSIYNYNNDILTLPGEENKTIYEINLQESQIINGPVELALKLQNYDNKCITLGGKDKILYKKANENGEIIEEKPIAINALHFTGHCFIDFYTVDCTGISFKFNKKPLAANFDINANKISNLDYVHHFFIECDDNFSFDFEIEKGMVYAVKEHSLIDNNKIYYSGNVDIKDFLVIEYMPGNIAQYNVYLKLVDSIINEEDIRSIMIKKIY